MALKSLSCSICGADDWQHEGHFLAPPQGETDYGFSPYERELLRCKSCGHFENRYGDGIDLTSLYDGDYWDSTYADKIRATFKRIMALPPEQSDNRGRVAYIENHWHTHMSGVDKEVLDIGSGLAVFPAVMKQQGWSVTALDPDANAAQHAREVAGVEAIAADFLKDQVPEKYALVTLNKVLEHVPDMVGMLTKVKQNLKADGLLYVELPDGEAAIEDEEGASREEFLVEHYCAFSWESYEALAQKSGFDVVTMERLVEPSGKYTLRGFWKIAGPDHEG